MEVIHALFLFAHFVGMGILLGGLVMQWREHIYRINHVLLWGAGVQLVTGLVLVGLNEPDVNHAKVSVKLGLLFILLLLLLRKRNELVSVRYYQFLSVIVLATIVVAVFF